MVAVTPIDGVTWQPRRQEGRLMINAFVFILKPGLLELRRKSATGQCATGQALHSDSMNQLLLHVAAEWFHRLSFFCLALPGVCVHLLNHMIYHSFDKVSCQNCDASAKHFRPVYEKKLRVNTLRFLRNKKKKKKKKRNSEDCVQNSSIRLIKIYFLSEFLQRRRGDWSHLERRSLLTLINTHQFND